MTKTISPEYEARMSGWLDTAGIRHWTPPLTDGTPGTLAFSPELVTLSSHPEILKRDGAREAVLEHHLDTFAYFTELLELTAVTPTCLVLRTGDVPFDMPVALAVDAGRIAADEIWHAECAARLRLGSSVPRIGTTPPFRIALNKAKAGLEPSGKKLADIAFACVSETLITGTLNKVPRDPLVRADVRLTLAEHAREEAYHAGVFGQVIGVMWEKLEVGDQAVIGPLFAPFIEAFLAPDHMAAERALTDMGFTRSVARKVALEAAEDGSAKARRLRAAAPTLHFLRQHGILEHDSSRKALEDLGFIA